MKAVITLEIKRVCILNKFTAEIQTSSFVPGRIGNNIQTNRYGPSANWENLAVLAVTVIPNDYKYNGLVNL